MKIEKVSLWIFSAVLLYSTVAHAAHTAVADSRITDVRVYSDRAMVKRTAELRLEQGENVIIFSGLPLHIVEETLRAEGKGTAAARISGLTVRNVFLERSNEKRIRDIEAEIDALERDLQRIEAKRTALAAQRAFIDSIRVGWGERVSKELALGRPLAAELTEANRFIGEGILSIEEGGNAAIAEKKPLIAKVAALKKQLADLHGDRRQEVRNVEMLIDAPRAMSLTAELSYLVMRAGWEPVYDIRLAADGKSAELVYRATVIQSTGEDWRGVKLSLSTASPAIGSAPPELLPWQVSFREPPRPQERTVRMMQKMAAPAPLTADAAEQELTAGGRREAAVFGALQVSSQIQDNQTSVLFIVPSPADIAADGSRQSILIALERVPVTAEYVTIPKLTPRVFLKSEVTNMTAYPLLAGAVNVFNDNAFVGRSFLKTVVAGEKFDLFFGVDDSIKVKRKVARARREAGLISGNLVSWRVALEVENFRSDDVRVAVYDQLPVAANQEIKVQLVDSQPKADEIRPDGTLLWNQHLKGGEKKKISFLIEVEYPPGREISGAE